MLENASVTDTTIRGFHVPSFVPSWHLPADKTAPVFTHAAGQPPVLFPPASVGQPPPEGAWISSRTPEAPCRIGNVFAPAPAGIELAELKALDGATQTKLLNEMAPLFRHEWGGVDDRYQTEQGVRETLRARSTSGDPFDRLYVMHLDGRFVATASLCRRDNPAFDFHYAAATDGSLAAGRKYADGFLVDLYTAEAFRGQGHATRLTRQVFDAAARLTEGKLHLYCEPELVPFYLRMGFGVVGHEIVKEKEKEEEAQATEVIMRFPAPRLVRCERPVQRMDAATLDVDKDLKPLPPEAFTRNGGGP